MVCGAFSMKLSGGGDGATDTLELLFSMGRVKAIHGEYPPGTDVGCMFQATILGFLTRFYPLYENLVS